jgi:long-subunit acyl-CoA synthetase (AMP-forming)
MNGLSQIVEGSCGVVTPNTECKIVDVSTGDNLPPHKTGELCIRGKVHILFFIFLNQKVLNFLLS